VDPGRWLPATVSAVSGASSPASSPAVGVALRMVALVGSLVVFAAAAWGALFLALVASYAGTPPDPTAVDGDPCCATPDTWSAALWVGAWSLIYAAVEGAIVALGCALVWWAVRRRWPRWRRLALVPGGAVVVVALAIVLAQLTQH
jgi:hypothetical protein